MKIAFAGKGGVGKTTLAAWTANYLAGRKKNVWLVDADTALSLGRAMAIDKENLPVPLIQRRDIIEKRIGNGIIHLNPTVEDLPEKLAVEIPGVLPGRQRLLVMGTVTNAGGGCACAANALLKALLSHIVLERNEWAVVDLEAGVEHLGRGTVAGVDALVIVTEPSKRGLETALTISAIAAELGLNRQILVVNRCQETDIVMSQEFPQKRLFIPFIKGLAERQLTDPSVLGLPEEQQINHYIERMLELIKA